eukprot:49772-Prymnesium_polylepis.1
MVRGQPSLLAPASELHHKTPRRHVLGLKLWVRDEMGIEYMNAIPFDLVASFEDASPSVPVFFLLSPGVDPLVSVTTAAPASALQPCSRCLSLAQPPPRSPSSLAS